MLKISWSDKVKNRDAERDSSQRTTVLQKPCNTEKFLEMPDTQASREAIEHFL